MICRPANAVPTRLHHALAALKNGRIAVVVDDVAGTGCDVVMLARNATTPMVAAMIRLGSGFICVTVDAETCQRLDLPPVVWCADAARNYVGSMRVAVDAVSGISTGISAHDRMMTIRVLANPRAQRNLLTRPGHVVPVLADPKGGLVSRPNVLAAIAGMCGDPKGSVAYCALVSPRDPRRVADEDELAFSTLPLLRHSDIAPAVQAATPRLERTGYA